MLGGTVTNEMPFDVANFAQIAIRWLSSLGAVVDKVIGSFAPFALVTWRRLVSLSFDTLPGLVVLAKDEVFAIRRRAFEAIRIAFSERVWSFICWWCC